MSLTDELDAEEAKNAQRSLSNISRILDELPVNDREKLIAVLSAKPDDPKRISSERIAYILRSNGYQTSPTTVWRARRDYQ